MHPSFFSTENHSKHYQLHYNPHQYIPLEDQPMVRSLFQQQKPFIHDHNHQPSLITHENSSLKNINVESNMKKSSYSYNNSHVVVEDKCIPSKRSSKKDRHSKINTARGPRDRRMRLSLDVAKKFFRLQDMLGLDKASNTIEWLIMKSKPAIQDLLSQHSNQRCSLIGVLNSASSGSSECEVLSGNDDQCLDKTGDQDQVISVIDNAKSNPCRSKKKVDRSRGRKSVYIDHTLAKETREKARARARKRASEKRINIKFGSDHGDQHTRLPVRSSFDKVIDQNTNRLGSWIPFGEINQVHTTDQPEYPSSHFQFKQGIAGEMSSVMSNNYWPMPSLFNFHNNPGSSHEHQLSDFQIQGKPWAGIHN